MVLEIFLKLVSDNIYLASNGTEAIEIFKKHPIDLVKFQLGVI